MCSCFINYFSYRWNKRTPIININENAPAMTTKITAETFRITIKLLALAALFVPLINIAITKMTIKKAGKFIEKPSPV
jgi:hypothetical protein